MFMRILVLGATGYIGGRLVPQLVEDGHEVCCLARTPDKLSGRPWRPLVEVLKGDLLGIVRARRLSVATMRNIRQNLFFAFVYNSAGVPIAAGMLFPFFGVLLSPIIAAAAMSLSSVSVIGNALRLRLMKL